jgi:hypothetical protein
MTLPFDPQVLVANGVLRLANGTDTTDGYALVDGQLLLVGSPALKEQAAGFMSDTSGVIVAEDLGPREWREVATDDEQFINHDALPEPERLDPMMIPWDLTPPEDAIDNPANQPSNDLPPVLPEEAAREDEI